MTGYWYSVSHDREGRWRVIKVWSSIEMEDQFVCWLKATTHNEAKKEAKNLGYKIKN